MNLTPLSFFKVFGAKPTIVVFSTDRRLLDNTSKHNLENLESTREVVSTPYAKALHIPDLV